MSKYSERIEEMKSPFDVKVKSDGFIYFEGLCVAKVEEGRLEVAHDMIKAIYSKHKALISEAQKEAVAGVFEQYDVSKKVTFKECLSQLQEGEE